MSSTVETIRAYRSFHRARKEMGEQNASKPADEVDENATGDFFDIKRPRLKYPEILEKQPQPIRRNIYEPYAYLGRIGYTKNRYQFRGANKDDNNIFGGQHMKKTLWFEEMRRRIIAEKYGISSEVDENSIAGTAEAYNIKSREKKNKYYSSYAQCPPSLIPSRSSSLRS